MTARNNNFDAIRLLAASLVLGGHAFAIMGHMHNASVYGEPISVYALFIFFSISGYLISISWRSDPNLGRFLFRRSLRIFPALFVMVLLGVFVLGPIVSEFSAKAYFQNIQTYRYVGNIALHYEYWLPGTFAHNPIASAFNVSIWSIPVEFFMYLITPVIFWLTGKRASVMFLILSFLFAFLGNFLSRHYKGPTILFYGSDVRGACVVSAYFAAGAFFGCMKEHFRLSLAALAIIFLVMIYHFDMGQFEALALIASVVLFAYVVLTICTNGTPIIRSAGVFGDFSYGIYLYAFPIEQVFALYFLKMNLGLMIILSFGIALCFGILSWRFVERRCIALKPKRKTTTLETLNAMVSE